MARLVWPVSGRAYPAGRSAGSTPTFRPVQGHTQQFLKQSNEPVLISKQHKRPFAHYILFIFLRKRVCVTSVSRALRAKLRLREVQWSAPGHVLHLLVSYLMFLIHHSMLPLVGLPGLEGNKEKQKQKEKEGEGDRERAQEGGRRRMHIEFESQIL